MGFAGFVLRGRGIGSTASGIAALLLLALMITGCSPPASKAPPPAQTASSQQNNPAPEPSPPSQAAPPAPTGGGAAAPAQSAPEPGPAGETAGSNYGADESGAATGGGGGPSVAYDMSPGGAAPPTAGEAETAAPPHPHRAAKSAPPKLTEEQARRLLEAERAMEQSDRALAARRDEPQAGASQRDGAAPPEEFHEPVVTGSRIPQPLALPEFPWPPPTPSDRMLLPRAGFARGLGANPSLSDVAGRLSDALGQAGYSQYSFYSAPGGFALVARLERIRPDGTPEPEAQRFVPPSATEPFSLGTYLKQLFIAPEGYYRLIVFVVTDNVVVTKGAAPTAATADIWLRNGADRLPPAYATMPFTKAHEVDALIYEFRKQGKGPATALLPSPLDARAHLQKAGLYSLLAGGAGH